MTRRAPLSPVARKNNAKNNALSLLAMGAAVILLGCGGGGGGGNGNGNGNGGGPGACGSASNSGQTVICGFVTNTSNVGVNNATVLIKNTAGQTVASGTTTRDAASGADGFYKITVPSASAASTLLLGLTLPTGFLPDYINFDNKNYDQSQNANSGGPCIPVAPISTINGDNRVTQALRVYSSESAPPPPVFPGTCPRQ
jgi:hypothetical protein